MAYVIKRNDGAYVSKPGNGASYTFNLALAQKWPTIEAARAELCPGNEHIVNLECELDKFRQ